MPANSPGSATYRQAHRLFIIQRHMGRRRHLAQALRPEQGLVGLGLGQEHRKFLRRAARLRLLATSPNSVYTRGKTSMLVNKLGSWQFNGVGC